MSVTPTLQKFLLNILVTSVALLLGDYLMDNVTFREAWVALIAALVLGILNVFLKPILIILTIPATIFTLGLFLLVINTAMIMIADQLIDDFHVATFWSAFLLSLFISIFNSLINGNVKIEKHRIDNP
jgi:putative membrane protein